MSDFAWVMDEIAAKVDADLEHRASDSTRWGRIPASKQEQENEQETPE